MTHPFNRLVHSFRFRLTLLFVGILAVILVVFSIFLYNRQQQVLYAEAMTRLSSRSAQLAAYYNALLGRELEESDEARAVNIPPENLALFEQSDLLAVMDKSGIVIQEHGGFQKQELETLMEDWKSNPTAGQPAVYMRTSIESGGRQLQIPYLYSITTIGFENKWDGTILLATKYDPGGQLERLALTLVIADLFLLLAAFIGGYWLADRAMRPVQTITQTVREIGESDLSRRLNLMRLDEIGELADTFDSMLARLQAAFERQRQFTADASHELRTPLAIIELEANRALEKRHSVEEYENTLQVIQGENERMSRLVQELLLLARMDKGQYVLRSEELDLSEIAVEVLERLEDFAAAVGVRLSTGTLAEAPIRADRSALSQLVTNLVENAIKYSQGDQAQALVQTGKTDRGGHAWVWVSVADNGPGIAAEHLPHLFDRFYQVDPARKQDETDVERGLSGSGLGLSIVDSIAKAYNGRIEVESKLGEGTIFTAWLMAE